MYFKNSDNYATINVHMVDNVVCGAPDTAIVDCIW